MAREMQVLRVSRMLCVLRVMRAPGAAAPARSRRRVRADACRRRVRADACRRRVPGAGLARRWRTAAGAGAGSGTGGAAGGRRADAAEATRRPGRPAGPRNQARGPTGWVGGLSGRLGGVWGRNSAGSFGGPNRRQSGNRGGERKPRGPVLPPVRHGERRKPFRRVIDRKRGFAALRAARSGRGSGGWLHQRPEDEPSHRDEHPGRAGQRRPQPVLTDPVRPHSELGE